MALLYIVKGVIVSEFPKWGRFVVGQFEQNGQKLYEDYKISIFGAKQWGTWGQANFGGSGEDPSSSPH